MRTVFLLVLLPITVAAGDFAPDPLSVRRHGPAYRYPQGGWIVLHIEGNPHERGYQHGTLLATEIAAYVRCFAAQESPKDPASGWAHIRRLTNALFLRKFDREYLEEMRGIADGAADAGAAFDGRTIDLTDIVAVNAWAELMCLDGGLDALPTGLEGEKFPGRKPKAMPAPKQDHCSAFAATGPATADGKVVFGYITMFGLYPARFYNVWLDVKPAKGHRVLMQSYPAGIQSGMDYYLNDAGLMVSETTIEQTRFHVDGIPLTNRIRKALQYGDTIDDVVKVLKDGNNGLYTNEWLLADAKTNEIAMFELGTTATRLWRSSKNEWFGGTEGFYWGCNNTKDLQVRLDTIPSVKERPHGMAWSPSPRDKKWLQFYARYKGQITVDTGKVAFTTPPICAVGSLDAKVTSTDMAKQLKTLAIFGPPLGGTWQPRDNDQQQFPEMVPLVPNDWTVLHPGAPSKGETVKVADLPEKAQAFMAASERQPPGLPNTKPAWHGTLLAKADGDLWLTEGFAAYERIVAFELSLRDGHDDGELTGEDKERLAVELGAHRSQMLTGSSVTPGDNPEGDWTRDVWLRATTGKGVVTLHRMHRAAGTKTFVEWMDEFGRAHAGKLVTADEFTAFVSQKWGKDLKEHAAKWLEEESKGPKFTVTSWRREQENTVIVYGTASDVEANRETALMLQKGIAKGGSNIVVPVMSDDEALKSSAAGVAGRHVLLVGAPAANKLAESWKKAFPLKFGPASFQVRDERFAHPGSAVVAAGENPLSPEASAVVIAGLSAEATQFAIPFLLNGGRPGNVLLLPNLAKGRSLLVK
ncbi:MAG TPA: C45 family autoproteolytic acyltransferase/hydrolase [Gemmataceae bacterium]|nr:C45 family autoproteolytic acyltransferase/hydrolase [Gemmataceae bacterium]